MSASTRCWPAGHAYTLSRVLSFLLFPVSRSSKHTRPPLRRYFLVEKAKVSEVIGIVVGTLGVEDYLDVIQRLKQLIKQAGKKAYLLVRARMFNGFSRSR